MKESECYGVENNGDGWGLNVGCRCRFGGLGCDQGKRFVLEIFFLLDKVGQFPRGLHFCWTSNGVAGPAVLLVPSRVISLCTAVAWSCLNLLYVNINNSTELWNPMAGSYYSFANM